MKFLLSAKAFFYILSAIFWPFVLSLISFLSLIFILQFLNNSELLLVDGKDFLLSIKFFIFGSLSYLPLFIPFCLLLSILFGYGKLSSNLELTAFSNIGYSKISLSTPALFLTFICFFICSNSIHTWGPNSKAKSKFINSLLIEKLALSALQEGVFLNNIPGSVFYAEEIKNSTKDLKKVFLLTGKDKDQLKFIFSDTGAFLDSYDKEESFQLLLKNGQLFGEDTTKKNLLVDFENYKVSLFKNQDIEFIRSKPDYLDSKKLLQKKGIKYKIEYHKRMVLSLTCFLFFFIALLLSLRLHSRSSSGKGFVLALALSLFFLILLFFSEYMSFTMKSPLWVYFPIGVFLIFVGYLFYWNRSRFII